MNDAKYFTTLLVCGLMLVAERGMFGQTLIDAPGPGYRQMSGEKPTFTRKDPKYTIQPTNISSAPQAPTALVASTVEGKHTVQPKAGYVPDSQTAIAIAVAVWNPIYGKKQIGNEKPYNAVLKDGVWTVTGSMPKPMLGGGGYCRNCTKRR
ncbi:MAG: NTF2 fold immunity protein [Chthoniobacterales bacterium]